MVKSRMLNLEITLSRSLLTGGAFLIMFEDAEPRVGPMQRKPGSERQNPAKEGRKNAVIKAAT